jgi:hypothetical protein
MIIIEGLSSRQRQFADRLWQFDTPAQCQRYISTLPSRMLRQECQTVFELMIWAALDQVQETDLALDYLTDFML